MKASTFFKSPSNVDKLINPPLRGLEDTVWGSGIPANAINLQFAENPYVFSIATKAIRAGLHEINSYPDSNRQVDYELLANYVGMKPDTIAIGNGADEILDLIARIFLKPGDLALVPIPSYPCYYIDSIITGAIVDHVPLCDDFSLDVNELIACIQPRTRIIWIANPNNPTGNLLLSEGGLTKLLKKYNGILVIDEAYFEFSGQSFVKKIAQFPNIIIVRTFSKAYGLAGIRFGYMVANPNIIRIVRRLQDGPQVFSVNRYARTAARAIALNLPLAQAFVNKFKAEKNLFENELAGIKGISVIPTLTSFSAFSITNQSSRAFRDKLKQRNVYIKDLSIYKGLPNSWVHFGIPKKSDLETVLDAIKASLVV